jgi:hypothetical protein
MSVSLDAIVNLAGSFVIYIGLRSALKDHGRRIVRLETNDQRNETRLVALEAK